MWAENGTCASGVQVTKGSSKTMIDAPAKANRMLATMCSGRTNFQLLRSKVNRRESAYTGGVNHDHTKEMVMFQASSWVQLSGLPTEAV